VPLIPDELPDLSGKRIFMSAGLLDPIIVTKQESEKLSKLFEQVGASVILQWQNSSHELTQEEIFNQLNSGCYTLDYETSKNILPLLSFENNACKASWILSRSNLFHTFTWSLS
jgi:hypothetical protein